MLFVSQARMYLACVQPEHSVDSMMGDLSLLLTAVVTTVASASLGTQQRCTD